MRLEAAIKGDLHKFMEQQKIAAETAVTAGVAEITDRIKNDLRGQVAGAGLGSKLAKSWQAKLYPKGKKSIDAAGWVFSKAPKLIRAFDEGTLIKSKDGFFLAIPTEAAPKRGVGGKRITPSNFPEHSLGRLRFVYRPGKISLLVVDGLRAGTGKRGGFRKASESALKTGRGLATVVMFFLVPQVKLRKRLDYKAVVNRWEPQLPQTILKHWPQDKGNDQQT
ncbi:MAG: hypothetical protein IPP74_12750 [Alphaproteobacteria bacterium]|nr:hypothetical protein [Alphaproteobacteria bacterium]